MKVDQVIRCSQCRQNAVEIEVSKRASSAARLELADKRAELS